jgi:hypothetical protein
MIIRYKYGFFYDEKLYGWNKKKLYRLPQMIGTRFYGLKECAPWKDGFILGANRKSASQLKSMTVVINEEIQIVQGDDLPF